MAKDRFYLDTSIQVERFGGVSRGAAKQLLAGGGHSTSTQVQREWNLFTLESSAALLNALKRSTDRQDIVARLRGGFGRVASRHWAVAEWIMDAETDLRVIEMRARDFQRVRARAAFRAGITTVRDGTECGVAKRRAVQDRMSGDWSYNFRCKKTDDICKQPQFLARERLRATTAATALLSSPRLGDAEMGKRALKVLATTPSAASKGKACYGGGGIGGDISIALECDAAETLITTDASFDLICPAINIRHRRI